MSTLITTNLKHASSSTNNLVLNSNGSVTGAGKILQVISSDKLDVWSTTSEDSWLDIPGTDQNGGGSVWCLKLTPAASSNKILLRAHVSPHGSANDQTYTRLVRDSTAVGIADAAGNRIRAGAQSYRANDITGNMCFMEHLDSPNSTSEITYKVQIYTYSSDTTYVNRRTDDRDTTSGYDARFVCNITAMEVSA